MQHLAMGDGLDLFAQMGEGLDEEAAGAGRGIEHRLAKARIAHGDHEPDEGVQLIGGGEVDAGHSVHNIARGGSRWKWRRGAGIGSVTTRCAPGRTKAQRFLDQLPPTWPTPLLGNGVSLPSA